MHALAHHSWQATRAGTAIAKALVMPYRSYFALTFATALLASACTQEPACNDDECDPDPTSRKVALDVRGPGAIRPTPLGEDCSFGCKSVQFRVALDSELDLAAMASCDARFVRWEGDCSAAGALAHLVVDKDIQCTAVFESDETVVAQTASKDTLATFDIDDDVGWYVATVQSSSGVFTAAPSSLWSLELWSDDGAVETRDATAASRSFCYQHPGTAAVELSWLGVETPDLDVLDVHVEAFALSDETRVRFAARVDRGAEAASFGIGRFDVPRIAFVDRGTDSELLLGVGGGLRIYDPATSATRASDGAPFDVTYPIPQTMRMNAYANGQDLAAAVVGVADEDPERFAIKQFVGGSDGQGNVLLAVGRRPSAPFEPRDLAVGGNGTVEVIRCTHSASCYVDVGRHYKYTVESEGYLTRPPIADASAVERDTLIIHGIGLIGETWPIPEEGPDYAQYRSYLDETIGYLDVEPERFVSVWYDWHANEFDRKLPAHLPPRGDFEVAVAAAAAAGHRVLPYTNPTQWNTTLPSYADHDIATAAGVVDETGELLTFTDAGGDDSTVLDYGTEFPRAHFLSELFTPLFAMGVGGIYLDFFPQIHRCFAANHGHPVGGGDSLIQGARLMWSTLGDLAQSSTGRRTIINEAMGDYLVDQSVAANWYRDIDLVQAGLNPDVGFVGVFDAAFRDRLAMTTIGPADMPGQSLWTAARTAAADGDPTLATLILNEYFMHIGWALSAGHVPVLIRRPLVDEANGVTKLREDPIFGVMMTTYRASVALRKRPSLERFLVSGSLATPLRDEVVATIESPLTAHATLPMRRSAVPTVYSHVLVSQEGDVGVSIFNWTGQPQRYQAIVDLRDYGASSTGASLDDQWKVVAHYAAGETVLGIANDNPNLLVIDVDVPPREPYLLVYEKTE